MTRPGPEKLHECVVKLYNASIDERIGLIPTLDPNELEQLKQLFLPRSDGHVNSKCTRDTLWEIGLVDCWNGWNFISLYGIAVLDILGFLDQDYFKKIKRDSSAPIDQLIYCPNCGGQHVDSEDEKQGWDNPPHKSHLCKICNHKWRVSDFPTNGVAYLSTRGQDDGSVIPIKTPICVECGCGMGRMPGKTTFKCGHCGYVSGQS